MEKKSLIKIIIWAVVASLLVNVFLSRWITAKISTLPILNRLGLLSPQAPIVITQREEVRVADPASLLEAVNKTKGRISLLAIKSSEGLSVLGGAVNLTADGLFLSVQSALPQASSQKSLLVLSDGRTLPVEVILKDPATDLVILKAAVNGLALASFGSSKDLQAGERVAILNNSLHSQSIQFLESMIKAKQSDFANQKFNSDRPSRSFELLTTGFLSGSTVLNVKGEVVGLISGNKIISADVIKKFIGLYFSKNDKLARPAFGFIYKMLTKPESISQDLPLGALILEVKKSLPAESAGLFAGDVIVSVEGENLNEETHLEEILEKFPPENSLKFKINRQGKQQGLILKAEELK